MTNSLSIVKNLIRINTENPPGETTEIINWIEQWAKTENIPAKVQWYEKKKGNIQLTVGDADKTILICGHLDTVPIGDINNWNYDPVGGAETNDHIYGRGSADMKSGVAVALSTLKRINSELKTSEMQYSITFLGTSDEEVGLGGVKASLELGLLDKAEFLIIPEPTGLKVGIAEKGVLWLSIIASGKTAHGSTPEKGINAIEEIVKLFPILHSSVPNHVDGILGKSTLNIGVIQGGNIANVVPERAEVQCDFRLVPPIQPADFSNTLTQKIADFALESPAKFECQVKQAMPVIKSSEDNYFVKKFLEKSGTQQLSGLNYATDGAILVSKAPKELPFVLYGPGNPKKIHISDERVSIQEIHAAEQTFMDFLTEVCFSR